jgi:ankyrin repeat protein
MLAAWWEKHEMVELLLKCGADPNCAQSGENTPLIHAAAVNDVRLARLLIEHGADLEKPNSEFETPLGFACAYGAVEVARLLCERGAQVNGTEGRGSSYLRGVQFESATNPEQAAIEQILVAFGARSFCEPPKLNPDD